MTWAHPSYLSLVLLVPVVLALAVVAWRARARAMAMLATPEVLGALVSPGAGRARGWQAALGVVAVAGLALAAAGPRLGFDWQQQKLEGVAIAIVLDVSRSMDAEDVSPSRMQRARREITDLVGLLRGDSAGLVLFAAGAYTRIPLTTDYGSFLWALQDSDTGTIRAQGTALSGALDAATEMLNRAGGTGKAVVVVSDGEVHEEAGKIEAAVARAKDAGVRIYALGVGDPQGAPIPLPEGGFKKDRTGAVVLSRLDEARLQALAEATGGAYVRAVASDDDVRALYVDEIRGKLEAAEHGVRREKLWHERFQWPLAVALLAMATSAALGVGRRPRVAKAAAAALLLVVPLDAWAGAREDGLAALRQKDWATAAEKLGQARVEDPDDVQVGQGLAEALYRAGRTREAEQIWQGLAQQDARNRAIHRYNAGNAAYRGGRLPEALSHFDEALKLDPGLEPAKKNREAVAKEIQLRLQERQEQEQEGEQQEGE
ncbi:MAG: VWA domain-containing protein, partial [Myxococcota bacterium]